MIWHMKWVQNARVKSFNNWAQNARVKSHVATWQRYLHVSRWHCPFSRSWTWARTSSRLGPDSFCQRLWPECFDLREPPSVGIDVWRSAGKPCLDQTDREALTRFLCRSTGWHPTKLRTRSRSWNASCIFWKWDPNLESNNRWDKPAVVAEWAYKRLQIQVAECTESPEYGLRIFRGFARF